MAERTERDALPRRARPRCAAAGEIDTVVAGFTDHHGRLCGKRFTADFFLEHVAAEGTHGCDYLLTTDLEMEPVPGYEFAGWDLGYGDVHLVPDLATLRRGGLARSQRAGALRRPPPEHPRPHRAWPLARSCAAQVDPLCSIRASRRWPPPSSSTSSSARPTGTPPAPGTTTSSRPGGTSRTTSCSRAPAPRTSTPRSVATSTPSGVPVESSKGEWGLGQHEVNVRYAEVLEAADRHVVFKQCLKETGRPPGRERDVHGQAARRPGRVELPRAPQPVAGRAERLRRRRRPRGRPGARVAGAAVVPRRLPALGARAGRAARPHGELLQAVRRRRRGRPPGSPGATTTARPGSGWSATTRACASSAASPGADCNPYLALAALVACRLGGDRAAGRTAATVRRRCLRRRVARPASPLPPRRHRRLRGQRAGRRAPWEPRWSSTTSTRSAPSRPPSTPR